ncbi:hypothetical protein [Natronoarchaeum rubrum]|uniref:hypothetical protein n=1 Tax=Natronoarchaeum rubrum TaxID=755311 RepID=UPI0021131A56|nr:hypothetical protein [Natronoarchaeum rubrum]
MPPEAGQSSTVREAVRSFLDDRPNTEDTLEAVLEVDADRETWTFEDIPADSGTFGELVSRGVVEKADGEYQLADPDAVAAAISGESVGTDEENSFGADFDFDFDISVDLRAMAGLAGALAFLFVMRITAYGSVMREEHVISPGNDPYYFRYWMEELLARSSGPTDWGVIANMPEEIGHKRPFTHASNWFIAELLGGGQTAATVVAAWLPVVASLAVGIILYKLATVLTNDSRVGIAAVLILATTPAHAVYTSIGFIDHQTYQYFWLGVMVLALTWLAVDLQRHRKGEMADKIALEKHLANRWMPFAVVGLGLGVSFSTHSWGGSPLVLIPVAGYLGLRAAMDVRENISPIAANLPVLVGLGIGAGLSYFFHAWWGWHETFVAYTPGLVFGGCIAVMVLGDLWRRFEWPISSMLGIELIGTICGLVLFLMLRPNEVIQLRGRVNDLFVREAGTEAQSLFAAEYGFIFGPLTQTGLAFYLALVPLGWATLKAYRHYKPGWLLITVFSWYFTVLAGIQMRFTGQLSLFVAILGGIGLVYVLSAVDLARKPGPLRTQNKDGIAATSSRPTVSIAVPDERGKIVYLSGLFVLFAGLGMLLVPSLVSQVTYSDSAYETAVAIEEHSDDLGREYPENYVLSSWDDNRMYNYFVNGESSWYGYAEDNYGSLIASEDPDGQYREFDGRVGYVVVTENDDPAISGSAYERLLRGFERGKDSGEDLSHFQLVSLDNDRSTAAYALVQGATINGSVTTNETMVVTTNVSVSGTSFTYDQETEIDENGQFEVVVPYPGDYTVADQQVTVTADDIENGSVVRVKE